MKLNCFFVRIAAIICLGIIEINADSLPKFGITAGTKGIGLKFSSYGDFVNFDFGAPFYYKYDNRSGDTIEMNHEFRINFYLGPSVKVINLNKNEFRLGLSWFPSVGYKYKNAYDTLKAKQSLLADQSLGLSLQYIRINNDKEKVFSFELFPFTFFFSKDFIRSLSPNVQLSIYIKGKN